VIIIAAKEIYDYVSEVTPDNNEILSLAPQTVMNEIMSKNDVIYTMDDESEERLGLGTSFIFFIVIRYDLLNESNAGIVMDFFCDASKGNGKIESFKFSHPDGHIYVVRFDTDLTREIKPTTYGVRNIRLKVLGKVLDA